MTNILMKVFYTMIISIVPILSNTNLSLKTLVILVVVVVFIVTGENKVNSVSL